MGKLNFQSEMSRLLSGDHQGKNVCVFLCLFGQGSNHPPSHPPPAQIISVGKKLCVLDVNFRQNSIGQLSISKFWRGLLLFSIFIFLFYDPKLSNGKETQGGLENNFEKYFKFPKKIPEPQTALSRPQLHVILYFNPQPWPSLYTKN